MEKKKLIFKSSLPEKQLGNAVPKYVFIVSPQPRKTKVLTVVTLYLIFKPFNLQKEVTMSVTRSIQRILQRKHHWMMNFRRLQSWEATTKHVSNDLLLLLEDFLLLIARKHSKTLTNFLSYSLSLPPHSYSFAQLSSKQQHTLVSVCECSQQLLVETLRERKRERCSIDIFLKSVCTQIISSQKQNWKCVHQQISTKCCFVFASLSLSGVGHNIVFVTSWANIQ